MNTKEQILAEGCGRGDNAARRELYDRYAGLLLGVCLRYTGERASAEDALHDAFLKIFGAIARFRYRGEGSLRAWMERIAVNTALERLRRERRLGEEGAASRRRAFGRGDGPDS
ncbi:RNA polymerase sigma factor, partial [uncultured Alistipes sp.]|uniref:RNA polymerase sigma factor n=1 Tax=uncultured Alistipes sp. TaxID=538949 RepID=UPI00265D6BD1